MGSFQRLVTHSHSHSLLQWTRKPPQVVDLSEGELSDSEQESPDSGTPELDQLMLTAEAQMDYDSLEQMDYDSFALLSPSVTRAPLWKFAEETPAGSQTQPQATTITVQAQPITITPVKPSGTQTQTQAPAQARPQAPAQAQPQAPAQTQLPRPVPLLV